MKPACAIDGCGDEQHARGLCNAHYMKKRRADGYEPGRGTPHAYEPAPPPPGPWVEQAACKGAPTEIWFSERGENRVMRTAKQICAECPVAEPCLAYALDHGIKHGTWGGKSERERRLLRRERRLELENA